MTVTAKKGKAHKIHISVDGEYFCTVEDVLWYSLGYSQNQDISPEALEELKSRAEQRAAYESGVRMLALRSHARKELENKLRRKFDAQSVKAAVDKLYEQGYINDEDCARQLARELLENKHWGIKRVEKELLLRGIDREIVNMTLQGVDNDPVSRIIMLLDTKFRRASQDEGGARRVFAALMRMGYSPSDIKRAMRERFAQLEDEGE